MYLDCYKLQRFDSGTILAVSSPVFNPELGWWLSVGEANIMPPPPPVGLGNAQNQTQSHVSNVSNVAHELDLQLSGGSGRPGHVGVFTEKPM